MSGGNSMGQTQQMGQGFGGYGGFGGFGQGFGQGFGGFNQGFGRGFQRGGFQMPWWMQQSMYQPMQQPMQQQPMQQPMQRPAMFNNYQSMQPTRGQGLPYGMTTEDKNLVGTGGIRSPLANPGVVDPYGRDQSPGVMMPYEGM